MPFGLTNTLATFQRWMNGILQPFLGRDDDVTVCYIDNVMIATKGTKEDVTPSKSAAGSRTITHDSLD
jgi:hypothetical protein